ncbi:hypothetical protein [Moorena sp. SIO3H5]|uniref:hypothetical protein n=1 Tax=Moorena sp. SIO3H5 TaxID=2607834 RepID=UPI0013BD5639|nr:hypothetical protein [Moorena sp. SIO3H5]NEO70343.1 hypothetical protein [Moorena sp. SIO3H5]
MIEIGNRELGIGNRESGIGNRNPPLTPPRRGTGIGNRESGIGSWQIFIKGNYPDII